MIGADVKEEETGRDREKKHNGAKKQNGTKKHNGAIGYSPKTR